MDFSHWLYLQNIGAYVGVDDFFFPQNIKTSLKMQNFYFNQPFCWWIVSQQYIIIWVVHFMGRII